MTRPSPQWRRIAMNVSPTVVLSAFDGSVLTSDGNTAAPAVERCVELAYGVQRSGLLSSVAMRWIHAFTISMVLPACATEQYTESHAPDSTRESQNDSVAAWRHLHSVAGPQRFAQVTERLYRGGQPSHSDLAALRAIGVTTVINLRAEGLGQRRAEWAQARELGLTYVEYPFFGVMGAKPEFLADVLQALSIGDGGAIYLHDKKGRDRSSLVVALYRVCVEGWVAEDAWNREVLAYGHRPTVFSREIELTFWDHAHHSSRLADTQAHSQAQLAKTALDPAEKITSSGSAPITGRLATQRREAGREPNSP